MKNLKKVLALVLAVVMIMGVVSVASAKTYKDADAEAFKNYADAIDALSSLKILDGFEDETFKADGTLTRAQAAKIVASSTTRLPTAGSSPTSPLCTPTHRTRSSTATPAGLCPTSTTAVSPAWLTA